MRDPLPLLLVLALFGCGSPPREPPSGDAGPLETDAPAVIHDARTPDDVTDAPDVTDAGDAGSDGSASVPCLDGCPAGMQCFTEGCIAVLPAGARCNLPPVPPARYSQPCAAGNACVSRPGGYVCVPYGGLGSYCRSESPRCDEGLGCDTNRYTGICERGVPEGEFCLRGTELCVEGASCREVNGVARCVRDGTFNGGCRAPRRTPEGEDRSAQCDPGLACVTTAASWGWWPTCGRAGREGDRCEGPGESCAAGLSCVAARGGRFCVHDGGAGARCTRGHDGARCDESGNCCDPGLRCLGDASGAAACVRVAQEGDACDGEGATVRCAEGTSCDVAGAGETGRCARAGTAAGADCRREAPPCDGELTCSNLSRYRATCQERPGAGDRCDLMGVRARCAEGSACLAAASAAEGVAEARCAVPSPESEPNDDRVTRDDAPTTSRLYAGELAGRDLRDCFAARVAEGASLHVDLRGTTFFPYAGALLHLYAPSGAEVGRWIVQGRGDNGPLHQTMRLSPDAVGALRGLSAGAWSVCVSLREGSEPLRYTLALSTLPPRAA